MNAVITGSMMSAIRMIEQGMSLRFNCTAIVQHIDFGTRKGLLMVLGQPYTLTVLDFQDNRVEFDSNHDRFIVSQSLVGDNVVTMIHQGNPCRTIYTGTVSTLVSNRRLC